jgi:hypothetical protein
MSQELNPLHIYHHMIEKKKVVPCAAMESYKVDQRAAPPGEQSTRAQSGIQRTAITQPGDTTQVGGT